jgi:transcriptional regulator with XRE-family HTH domain
MYVALLRHVRDNEDKPFALKERRLGTMSNEQHRTNKPDTLGTFIASQRERMGLSQRQLAALAGVHHSLIARLESGEIVAGRSPEHMQAIADVLEVDVSELLSFVGIKPTLPEPRVYFRRKFGVNAKDADILTQLIEDYQAKQQRNKKGGTP